MGKIRDDVCPDIKKGVIIQKRQGGFSREKQVFNFRRGVGIHAASRKPFEKRFVGSRITCGKHQGGPHKIITKGKEKLPGQG